MQGYNTRIGLLQHVMALWKTQSLIVHLPVRTQRLNVYTVMGCLIMPANDSSVSASGCHRPNCTNVIRRWYSQHCSHLVQKPFCVQRPPPVGGEGGNVYSMLQLSSITMTHADTRACLHHASTPSPTARTRKRTRTRSLLRFTSSNQRTRLRVNPSGSAATRVTEAARHTYMRFKTLEEHWRWHGINMLGVLISTVLGTVIVGIVLYFNREPLRDNLSDEISTAAKRSLSNEEVVAKANEVTRDMVYAVLTDPMTAEYASQFLTKLFAMPDTRTATANLLVKVFIFTMSCYLSQVLVYYLVSNELGITGVIIFLEGDRMSILSCWLVCHNLLMLVSRV